MSDEEIEFLGTKPAVPPVLQRPVTEIVLHVERNGTNDPYRLSFNRSSSSVIHVGRRPGAESEARTRDIDSGRAMFRCAVVSRKHAKIAFSDSGHVYLIDLSSHHGTHVRKPSEMFSKPLKPEVAFQLSDGDIVTFGKPVGRHEECVRPVVVRVELVRNPQPIKPLVVPSTPSDKSSTSSLMKHSSGRYGVYSSSSSDERPSSSMDMEDNDSEIEGASAAPKDLDSCSSSVSASSSQSRQGSLPLASGFGRAFDMLKRLIPPSHTPNIGVANESVGAQLPPAFTLAPIAPPSSEYVADIRFDSPSFNFWPFYSPSPPYPILPPLQEALSFSPQPRGNSLVDESRSSSPMDLESPSPGPFAELPEEMDEGSLGGDSRAFDDEDDDESSGSESRGECQSPSYSVDSDAGEDAEQREKSPSVVVVDSRPKTPEVQATTGAVAAVESTEAQETKRKIDKLQADVNRLDEHRRKYRTRFNNNVHKLADKLSHYDDRLAEVNAQYDNLAQKVETISRIEISDINNQLEDMSEQIENLAYVDIPDLQSQVDSMGEDISGLSTAEVLRRGKEAFPPPDKTALAQQEAEEQVKTLKELVNEMKGLREATKAQMLDSVNELKEMCKATMEQVASEHAKAKEALATAVAVAIAETPAPVSLKRKREEEDEEEAEAMTDGDVTLDSDVVLPQASASVDGKDAEMVDFGVDPIAVAPPIALLDSVVVVEATNPADPSPRPRKRLRRLATVVGHTATAVTLGAVATWTALAFA